MNGLAHAGGMRQFVSFAGMTGLDLASIFDDELMAAVRACATAEWVPANAHVDALQAASLATGRTDIGVAFAMWCNVRAFGPVSLLWDHCCTLEESNRITRQYLHLETMALGASVELAGTEAALRHTLMVPTRFGGSQFLQGTLTLELRVIRMLLGDDWAPLRLELDHPAPGNYRYHQAVFRCPIEFGADRCAIVLDRVDMTRPSVRGNANMVHYIERQLASVDTGWQADILQQVEHLVAVNLLERNANLNHIARLTGLGPQSLQRRLAERGESFAQVLERVRRRTAEEYFRVTLRPNLTELAHRLGYTDSSAASRFLRQSMDTCARTLAVGAERMRGLRKA